MEELKTLDLKKREFVANGSKYYILGQLTAERFKEMQKLQIELGFEASYKELYDTLNSVYELLNERKGLADAAVMIHDCLNGLAGLEQRYLPIQKYCACFIVREDEDVVDFSEKLNDEKIDDWNKEGIAIDSFFALAVNMVNGLKENYLKSIQDTLEIQDETVKT